MNDWKVWLYSVIAAFIGGGASSAVVMYIDPAKFNFRDGLGNLGAVFFVTGLLKVLAYLSTSPLPAGIMSTIVTKTATVTKTPMKTQTTEVTKTETTETPAEKAPTIEKFPG